MDDLDSFDRQILSLLRRDSRRTGEELSAEIGLSPASCLRRVQRLRKIGAIQREVAIVSPALLGTPVTIVVLLTLRRGGRDRVDHLRQRLMSLEPVESLMHVTGPADFVLTIRCASMEAYAAFTEANFYDDVISGFESLVVLRDHS